MDSTDGLYRGMEVINTGRTISMPAANLNGRLLNVIGDTIDGIGPIETNKYRSIHQDPPTFENLTTTPKYLYTASKLLT